MEINYFISIILLIICSSITIFIFFTSPIGVAILALLPYKKLKYNQKYSILIVSFFHTNIVFYIICTFPILFFPTIIFLQLFTLSVILLLFYYFIFYLKSIKKIKDDNLWQHLFILTYIKVDFL